MKCDVCDRTEELTRIEELTLAEVLLCDYWKAVEHTFAVAAAREDKEKTSNAYEHLTEVRKEVREYLDNRGLIDVRK